MQNTKQRVCIIGAGPSGMSQMIAFKQAAMNGEEIPEIVCYEKQTTAGGLWNYTWRTGLDEFGEAVHGSMYRQLFSNAPKECLEVADYTFEDHFGKAVGSYPPRESLHQYLIARFNKYDCESWVRCNTSVRNVKFNEQFQKFTVATRTLSDDHDHVEVFDYVIVACGHFSTPNMPQIPGMNDFTGRIVHAHDVRNAQEFRNQRILVVGTSYSAEDIASMCWKNGCKSVVCSYRSTAMPYEWPQNFTTVPILTSISGETVTFKDGSTHDVDAIIMATGYLHHIPFMEESLRLRTPNVPYPAGLYKSIFWQSNPRCLYLGMPAQAYTIPMFTAQGWYARDVILGKIQLPSEQDRQADIDKWLDLQGQIDGTVRGFVAFQGAYIDDLNSATDCLDNKTQEKNLLWVQWRVDKEENIMTFRDKNHQSAHTGLIAGPPKVKWTEQMDFSDEGFRANVADAEEAVNNNE